MSGLAGRVALVTGAGQGIGAAVARRLAAAGALVAVNSLHVDKAQRTADELTGAGGKAVAVPGDVANPADVESFIAETEATLGPVEVLVNNAATLSMAPFAEFDADEFDRIVQVNLTGPMLCTHRVLPAMLSARWGRIIMVASIWGLIGARGATPYSASKGGLIGLTRALADDVTDRGVSVVAIAPGVVDTPQLAADAAFAGISLTDMKERYADDTLIKRIATAEEIAGLIVWLAADRTGAFSGQTIAVTGGRSE
jgi:NAD(P)-dependent dehydrogenase (short-subunit alcohol dehydrogenase family)